MKSFYELLGEEKIRQLVTEFYRRVFASEKIRPLFQNEQKEIEEKQFLFLSQFLGGPQKYSELHGHPRMRMRHMPHKITQEAKEEWLHCMKGAIETLDLPNELKVELFNVFPKLAEHMVNS